MSERTFEVRFAVEEHPDTEREVVTVKAGIIGGASPKERAVVAAAGDSSYTHAETLAIQEVDDNE
jgi:hypothetical protein